MKIITSFTVLFIGFLVIGLLSISCKKEAEDTDLLDNCILCSTQETIVKVTYHKDSIANITWYSRDTSFNKSSTEELCNVEDSSGIFYSLTEYSGRDTIIQTISYECN